MTNKDLVLHLLELIVWSQTMPFELKKSALELVMRHAENTSLLEELIEKLEIKMESEDIAHIRDLLTP